MGKVNNIIFKAMHQQISQEQKDIIYPYRVSIYYLTTYLISFNALKNIHRPKVYYVTPIYQSMHRQISQDQKYIY